MNDMLTPTQLAADRLVKVIVKKHLYHPQFALLMQYRNLASYFDLVPRPYDGMLELCGFLQDPRYTEDPETANVPFRRWFPLAIIDGASISSLY